LAQRLAAKGAGSASDAIRSLTDTAYREHAELLYMMHELSRMISTRVDKAMSANRVTHAQWWALMHIYERGEGRTQTELADLLQIGRASTGKLLERLEAKRWIERRTDKDDSRVRRVYLRNEVVPIFKLMTEEGKRLFQAFLEDISATEEARLIAGLRKIRASAERAVGWSAQRRGKLVTGSRPARSGPK
jgi:DNA-binding MarR family transcriptional regulator